MNAAIVAALLSLVLGTPSASAPTGELADGLLSRLAALEGEWLVVGEDGKPTDEVALIYRVVAGGHAVLSTEFPGTDHEMVTVYHREGEGVAMTHYCGLGNRPHMVALAYTGDRAEFACAEGSELDAKQEKHMHHGTFVFTGENEMRSAWVLHDGGEAVWTADFHVVRRSVE